MRRPSLSLLLATGLLSGCAALEALNSPWFHDAHVAVQNNPVAVQQRWWNTFDDPLMDQLADRLVAQNIDLQIAQSRLREARAATSAAASQLYPDVALAGTASRGNDQVGSVKPGTILQGGFDAAWELDLFGSNRAALRAAEARSAQAAANVADARNSLLADLFRAIIEWRRGVQVIRETEALLATQDDQVALFAARSDAGLIDASFTERARAQREQTATQLPLATAAAAAAQFQIERLLGAGPGDLKETLSTSLGDPLPVPSPAGVGDIPLTTLKNRPDVRSAAAALQAAQADLAQAEADLWPKLSIGAFFGLQDASDSVRIAENPAWSLASSLSAPLLNFGRLRSAVDAADARQEQAALAYENTVLLALQEAHTALADYLQGVNAMERQRSALERRRETVALARTRFEQGLTDMTDLTTAQSELDEATIALIERQAAAATAYIRLQKALGTAVAE